ncbi:MAG TPA: HD domain-containing protein [Longimicrobiaceae bacterium]|nr:HD domain-containing protein [Longimicrobiaceae bacterium]
MADAERAGGGLPPGEVLGRTESFVRERLAGEGTGHDWWHVHRVRRAALRLAGEEGADPYLVELGALLHDVADHKFHGGDETAGPRVSREWLESLGVDEEVVDRVCAIVAGVSFKGAGVPTPMDTAEGRVVQDADRLDALGAVGIARAFAYGGSRGRPLYDPAEAPTAHDSFAAYRSSAASTLNHFHEKLFLLQGRMQTAAGRRLAGERHRYMEAFVARFLREWEGADVSDHPGPEVDGG